MAEIITVICPECATKMKAPAQVEGKKAKCKKCGASFVARDADRGRAPAKPAAKGGKPAKPAEPEPDLLDVKPADDDDEGSDPYGVTETVLTSRCPQCANEMEPEDIICLHCGYNTRTREQTRTRKVVDQTFLDFFLWLLPGILCVLFILAAIIWDIVYCLYADDWYGEAWYNFLASGAIKMWMVIITIFFMAAALRFAIKRLILHNKPPEIEKY
jgi:DNA-directed RNA polymerase subunit M/transcription elongation factor TFIIS